MAELKQSLVEYLKADGGVTGLAGQRIYPEVVPMPGSFPRLYLRQEGQDRPRTLSSGSTRQPVTRLAFVCQGQGASGYADAQALAQAVLDATGGNTGGQRLEDFGGAWLGKTNKVWVKAVVFDDVAAEQPEQAPGATQKWIHGLTLMATIHWNEATFS